MLDDQKVVIGDVLYDILLGNCTVMSVSQDGTFAVKKGESTIQIAAGGFIGKTRRVYWANPIIIIPRKDDRSFVLAAHIAKETYKAVNDPNLDLS